MSNILLNLPRADRVIGDIVLQPHIGASFLVLTVHTSLHSTQDYFFCKFVCKFRKLGRHPKKASKRRIDFVLANTYSNVILVGPIVQWD